MNGVTLYFGQLAELSIHAGTLQIDSVVSMRIIRANTPAMPLHDAHSGGFFASGGGA